METNSFSTFIPQPNSPPRQFKCFLCSKYFKNSGDRNRHERSIHSAEQPFTCEFCGQKFSRKDNLQVHQRSQACQRMRNRNEFSTVLQELRQNNSQPKTSTFFPNVSAEQEAEFAFRLAMSQVQAQQSSSSQNTDTSYKILPIKSMKRPPSNPISVQSQENKRSNFEIKTEPFEMLNESFGFTQVFQDRQHSPLLENESASNHMEFIPYDNSSQSASEMTNQETNQDDMRESTPSSSAQRELNRRFDLTYLAKSVQFLEAKINELLSDEKSENIEIIDKLQRMADIVISVLKQAYELDASAGKLIRNRIKYFLMLNQQTNLLDFCEIQPIILELIDQMRLWKQQESETIL